MKTPEERKQYFEQKLREMPPDVLEKAIAVFQTLPDEFKAECKARHAIEPDSWMACWHHDAGRHLRNMLRVHGLGDALLPDKNWDDYYIQVLEISLGLRNVQPP
ncbi:hypothetical protein NDA01_21820 [Trichocoleus desertorum AS-A10]|uniref:hypothetical protein n=1 Tax=Trichocoleus desertorum TaxID=1481672 RepID=UPI0032977BF6